MISQLEL